MRRGYFDTHPMGVRDLHQFIQDIENDIAFLIGNGINRYPEEEKESQENKAWKNLLLDIWHNENFRFKESTPVGSSFPEFCDLTELFKYRRDPAGEADFRHMFCKRLDEWENTESSYMEKTVNYIKDMNAPILTTNFDDFMSKSIGISEIANLLEEEERKDSDLESSWSNYYSNKTLDHPNDGFAIWHIHGMRKYPSSIILGLSHYMDNVAYVNNLMKDEGTMPSAANHRPFRNTWLEIFFQKPLFIFGLDLGEYEFFLRWLLIQKVKRDPYITYDMKGGWYVIPASEHGCLTPGKRLFMESVGIQILVANDFKNIYETPWT